MPSPPRHASTGPHRGVGLVLAGVGAALGTGAEYLHLQAGVWALPAGASFPLWIAVVYFLALVVLLALLRLLERESRVAALPRPSAPSLVGETLAVVALFAAPMAWPLAEGWLTAALLLYLALRLFFLRHPGDLLVGGDLRLCAGLFLADALLESALLRAGLYRYPGAHLLTFPLWGPLLWAALGLSLRRLVRAFGR